MADIFTKTGFIHSDATAAVTANCMYIYGVLLGGVEFESAWARFKINIT